MKNKEIMADSMLDISLSSEDSSNDKEIDKESCQENSDHVNNTTKNLFKLFIRHKWTITSLVETASLINSIPGTSLPTTKYLLIKDLLNISSKKVYKYYECCKIYHKCELSERKRPNCSECNTKVKKDAFFVYINLEEQIYEIINKYFDEIIQYNEDVKKKVNITDIYNANYLKNLLQDQPNIWALQLNTDGVAIIKSSSSSMWPILLTCNFLPPQLRFKDENIIVAALFFSKRKPDFTEFFRPLAEEFTNLSSNGIFVKERIFKIFITNASLDLPAKSSVSQLKQFNSRSACNFCLDSGESTLKGIRYTNTNKTQILRTHHSMIKDIARVIRKPGTVMNGIKGISPMISFDHFDMAKSFCVDYMHCVLLGVVKNLLQFWTDPKWKKHPYFLQKSKRTVLSSRLTNIKPPTYISRAPRSLEYIKLFKSSEYRSLLLYYLPVCLDRLLPEKYLSHFRTLSSCIYTLLQPSLSSHTLKETEEKMRKFVHNYEQYYGKLNMTMNVHSLLHLVECVVNFGPLWSFSMFPFESYNGLLKSFVVAPTDVLYQITMRYISYKSLHFGNSVKERGNALQDKKEVIFKPEHVIAAEEADLNVSDVKCYTRYTKNGITYTSRQYVRAKKSVDYCVLTKNQSIYIIEFYFVTEYKQYAMCEILNVNETIEQIKNVALSNCYRCVKVDEFEDRCVFMEVMKQRFIVKRPNSFERN